VSNFSKSLSFHAKAYPGGLTKLAAKAHLSRPSLYDAMSGKSIPRPQTMERILRALDLSEKYSKELKIKHQIGTSLSTRKKRMEFIRSKENFAQQVGSYLLAKGLEVSYLSSHEETDLVVRTGEQRLPILALPIIHDYPKALGVLLIAMYEYSSSQGFVCIPKITPMDRRKIPAFDQYGITIIPFKNLPKILSKS
jgi:transcriptional regulator with XRE-family HTH domain